MLVKFGTDKGTFIEVLKPTATHNGHYRELRGHKHGHPVLVPWRVFLTFYAITIVVGNMRFHGREFQCILDI